MQRYLAEFESRFNMAGLDGGQRVDLMLQRAIGQRLTYAELIEEL